MSFVSSFLIIMIIFKILVQESGRKDRGYVGEMEKGVGVLTEEGQLIEGYIALDWSERS